MPSEFTDNLRLTEQGIGENDNTWGAIANSQYDLIEDAITGVLTLGVNTGVDITLSTANGAIDEARNAVLRLVGTPIADINIIVPSVQKTYHVDASGLAGTFTVSITPTGGGDSVSFGATETGVVYCDAVNVNEIIKTTPDPFLTNMIMLWAGSIATIPDGWVLCDGTNNAPDLRDRFVVGATQDDNGVANTNITGSLTLSGGSTAASTTGSAGAHDHGGATLEHALVLNEIPSHTHDFFAGFNNGFGSPAVLNSAVVHDLNGTYRSTTASGTDIIDASGGDDGHAHDITSDGNHTHSVTPQLPPYYALAYIMKT